MFTKFKVFLLIGCFLLIATTAFAEPFWQFHAGHQAKYNISDSSGASWVGTMDTIGIDTACGKEYWHVTQTNFNNTGDVVEQYIKVEEDAAYQCDAGYEIKFLQTGEEGTKWTTAVAGGTLYYEIVARLMHGTLYATRYFVVTDGGHTGPASYKFFVKGMGGSIKRVDYSTTNAPTIAVRQGFSGDTLYATWASGLYTYDYAGPAWSRIHTVAPTNMVASGPILYATWASGLYVWDGTAWFRIHTAVPTKMVAVGSNLYATWASGLYQWNGSAWSRIHSVVPTNMFATDFSLYATWASGLYQWNGSAWSRIHSVVPTNIIYP